MSCEDGDCEHGWHYAPYRSLRGGLERGRGISAARLLGRPAHADVLYELCAIDTRWDWQVDHRYTYLARLVRDLRLDPGPLVEQLRACGPDRYPNPSTDADNRFELAVGVLEALARAGMEQPREALRAYVGDGTRWLDALSTLTYAWPASWWDDLWPDVAARVGIDDAGLLWSDQEPWRRWRGRDLRLDRVLDAAVRTRPDHGSRRGTLDAASDTELIALLRSAGDDRRALTPILAQIRRRGRPIPELLDLVEQLARVRPAGLFGALKTLGPQVVPAARRWAGDAAHPLALDAPHLLARHGDESDIPVLLAAMDRLADEWCGYDVLAEGLTRILTEASPGPHTETRAALIRRLRWLTDASPHSYERACYLRSLLLLDPARTAGSLRFHLLDCEPEVRLMAARHTPLTDAARRWLTELRDDPIEEEDVRQAAAERRPGS